MASATAALEVGMLSRRVRLSAAVAVPLVVACFAAFGATEKGCLGAFFVTVLALLTVIDLEERRLPNVIVLPALVAVLTAHLVLSPDRALEWTLAAVGAAVFLFLPSLVMPGGMGMGDFKLALLLGAMLGTAVVTAVLVASVTGALAGVAVLAARGAAARKQAIPFGPFLALGGVVALFVGNLPSL